MSQSPLAIVLAAGKGTRMKTDLPKVLVPACGRPLVDYVLTALKKAGVDRFLVVVGYQAERVRDTLASWPNLEFAHQTEQLGTGHAVKMCLPWLADQQGPVLIVTGDSPMTQSDSLRALLDLYEKERPACVLGTLIKDDPTGLGRILRDDSGNFQAIVEERDANPDQRAIREVNMSTYVFHGPALVRALGELRNDNRQGEFYITDCPGILKAHGEDVRALPVLKACEALSVNTVEDLQRVELELGRAEAKQN